MVHLSFSSFCSRSFSLSLSLPLFVAAPSSGHLRPQVFKPNRQIHRKPIHSTFVSDPCVPIWKGLPTGKYTASRFIQHSYLTHACQFGRACLWTLGFLPAHSNACIVQVPSFLRSTAGVKRAQARNHKHATVAKQDSPLLRPPLPHLSQSCGTNMRPALGPPAGG